MNKLSPGIILGTLNRTLNFLEYGKLVHITVGGYRSNGYFGIVITAHAVSLCFTICEITSQTSRKDNMKTSEI